MTGERERVAELLTAPPVSTHAVQFYEDVTALGGIVAKFVAAGLAAGEPALVIATPEHRRTFEESLAAHGTDVRAAAASSALRWLDAREMLSLFMAGGTLDRGRFEAVIGAEIAAARAGRPDAPVRILAELADVLWAAGNEQAALGVEEAWSELARTLQFSLVCTHVMGHFYRASDGERFHTVCRAHTHVLPTEAYSNVDRDEKLREIALLQQRGRALESEIAERTKIEAALHEVLAERARFGEALRRSNRDLDQFAYVASHELKSPLRAIASLAQWIEDDHRATLAPEALAQLELLRSRVHKMEAIIDGILDYSRAGRTMEVEDVDVNALLGEVLDAQPPGARAAVTIAQDMPRFATDRVPLYQVFQNLVGNAIKYTRCADAKIVVAVEDAGQFFHFSVADNGPGIPAHLHERIWKVFARIETHGPDVAGGSGIGLSVVRKITEMRGGRVWLESTVGQGSTFHFTWPKSLAPSALPA